MAPVPIQFALCDLRNSAALFGAGFIVFVRQINVTVRIRSHTARWYSTWQGIFIVRCIIAWCNNTSIFTAGIFMRRLYLALHSAVIFQLYYASCNVWYIWLLWWKVNVVGYFHRYCRQVYRFSEPGMQSNRRDNRMTEHTPVFTLAGVVIRECWLPAIIIMPIDNTVPSLGSSINSAQTSSHWLAICNADSARNLPIWGIRNGLWKDVG